MAKHVATGTPTQVAHPIKAVFRTVAAYTLAVGAVIVASVPLIQEHLGPYLPPEWTLWLTAAAGFAGALVALVTRLMALAQVQDLLAKIGLGTGVENENPATPTELEALNGQGTEHPERYPDPRA